MDRGCEGCERDGGASGSCWTEGAKGVRENIGHGLPGTADRDVTQTIGDSFSTMRKYVTFINRNRDLYDEVMEEEINPFDISIKKDGKRNTACMSKVLRENVVDVIEFNSCESSFGGLGVACWPLVPKFAGSNPAEAVRFFRA